jgi:hypothetical protein
MTELADEIYDDPAASLGVQPGGNVIENWVLEERGGCSYYRKVTTQDELEELKHKRNESHPDRPNGSHEKFLEADEKYKAALNRRI